MMNERIFELANKANEEIGYTFKMEDAKQLHELMEKFSKMVAQDIADQFAHVFTDEKYQRRIDKEILKRYGIIQ